jgi:hypothetical protein
MALPFLFSHQYSVLVPYNVSLCDTPTLHPDTIGIKV